jgi:general secretion pathway protein C
LVWAALAGSLVFWGLRLGVRPGGLPPQAQTVATDQAVRGDVLRMLGAVPAGAGAPAAPAAAARFRLIGAVAQSGGGGWAMLAVDDRPARVVRVGSLVDERWVLQSVSPRQVEIGPQGGAAQLTLDLPRLPPPATGVPGQATGPGPGPAAGVARVVPVPAALAADTAPPVPPVQVPAVPAGVMPGQPQDAQAGSSGGPAGDPGAVR